MNQKPFTPDPDYDLIEHRPPKRGVQCGKCGMKFEANQAYGYYCSQSDCPVQPRATC